MEQIRIAILTISDGVAAGTREDRSGDAIEQWAVSRGFHVDVRIVVPDRHESLAASLCNLADSGRVDLVLTTGGTGLTARDVTPEATRFVLEREAPGIAEAIRAHGAAHTPYAWLSRAVAGTRKSCLIVNLPGSEGGVRDGLAVLDKLARHAVQLLRGVDTGRHEPADG